MEEKLLLDVPPAYTWSHDLQLRIFQPGFDPPDYW
jgi:hypothetical protein